MTNSGLTSRPDGRADDQLRPIQLHVGYQDAGEGSVLIEQGRTRVVCTASVEPTQPPHLKGSSQGWVTAEYSMLPRANIRKRAMREAVTGHRKGRTFEIERMIGRALRAVTDLKAIGPRTIYIDCDVLQADGGTRTASIIGAYLALAQACTRGVVKGDFKRLPVRSYVAAVSCGIVHGRPLIDLTYDEDSAASVDMNVICSSDGRLIEIQAAGEGCTFGDDDLMSLLEMSRRAAGTVFDLQRAALPIQFPAVPVKPAA